MWEGGGVQKSSHFTELDQQVLCAYYVLLNMHSCVPFDTPVSSSETITASIGVVFLVS